MKLPKLQHHRASGRARVWLNKRYVYLGQWGAPETDEAYRRLMAEYVTHAGVVPPASDEITVGQLIILYLKHAQRYYGETSTSWVIVKTAVAPVLQLYSRVSAVEFGPRALRAVRALWEEERLSRTTINKYVSVVKAAFRWAASQELLPVEVVTALDTLAGLRVGRTEAREPEKIEPVPEADRRAVLLRAPGVLRDMIRVQTFCGCRPGELCALRRGDIDTSGRVWVATVREHKGSWREDAEPREIAFGPRCQRILKKYLLRPAGAYIFDPREAVKQRAAAKPTHRRPGQKQGRRRTRRVVGDHYTTASYRRAVHRLCKDAGVTQWSPHQLRKNAATRVRERYGLDAAQIVLGHADADVTQIYAKVNRERLVQVMGELG